MCFLFKPSNNDLDNFKRHLLSKKQHMPELARTKEALLEFKRYCEDEDIILQRTEKAAAIACAVLFVTVDLMKRRLS